MYITISLSFAPNLPTFNFTDFLPTQWKNCSYLVVSCRSSLRTAMICDGWFGWRCEWMIDWLNEWLLVLWHSWNLRAQVNWSLCVCSPAAEALQASDQGLVRDVTFKLQQCFCWLHVHVCIWWWHHLLILCSFISDLCCKLQKGLWKCGLSGHYHPFKLS